MELQITLRSGRKVSIKSIEIAQPTDVEVANEHPQPFYKGGLDTFGQINSHIDIATLLTRYPTARQLSFDKFDPHSGNMHTTTITTAESVSADTDDPDEDIPRNKCLSCGMLLA